jgi:hypothetical protein
MKTGDKLVVAQRLHLSGKELLPGTILEFLKIDSDGFTIYYRFTVTNSKASILLIDDYFYLLKVSRKLVPQNSATSTGHPLTKIFK